MNAMNASSSHKFESAVTTRILKLESASADPWVVCTLDAVPIILARFSTRESAEQWQAGLRMKTRAA
ncbi:MAG: hypothetical protein MK089_02440 [Phycisphaerales bacterium]|nr:hypothetical protein [Phycisphaerales bacterium]